MVVPLGDTRFCRIDSNHGKLEYESYGPNMGEMTFSITAISHADISAAWKRFTDADEPGAGKRWQWEKSATGRFFVYVPHWFLIGVAAALASVPWLPWRLSLRTLLIATVVLAVLLGLLIWTNANPPKSHEHFGAILSDLKNAADKEERMRSNSPMTKHSSFTQEQNLDFARLLNSVDDAIGKRFPTPQADATHSATYEYNGPIEKVLDVVAPIAKESGFSEETGGLDNTVEQTMQKILANGVMKMVDFKAFTHPNGEMLTVSSMAIGKTDMKMLTITYSNRKKLPTVGEKVDPGK